MPAKDISNKVMAQIKKEHITMKPHWYFVLGALLLALGLISALLVTTFFMGLIMFHFRTQAPLGFLHFGPSGLKHLVASYPFGFLLVAGGSIVSGLQLLKQYDFTYKTKPTHIILTILLLVIGGGLLVDQIGMGQKAYQHPQMGLFRKPERSKWGVVGIVKELTGNQAIITTPDNTVVTLQFITKPQLTPGEMIQASGTWKENIFQVEQYRVSKKPRQRNLEPRNHFPRWGLNNAN